MKDVENILFSMAFVVWKLLAYVYCLTLSINTYQGNFIYVFYKQHIKNKKRNKFYPAGIFKELLFDLRFILFPNCSTILHYEAWKCKANLLFKYSFELNVLTGLRVKGSASYQTRWNTPFFTIRSLEIFVRCVWAFDIALWWRLL